MAAFTTTVLVAVVTALLGIVSYLYQKRTDRHVELRKQQQEAYELYIKSYHDWTLTETSSDEEKKANDKYWQAYYALFPLASDGFLRAAMSFHAYAMEGNPDYAKEADRKQFKALWTNLVVEMRNDANVESRLSKREIEDHVPWYFSSYESTQGGIGDTSATQSPWQCNE